MRKRCLLALALILMLSFSGYAQSDSETQPESKGSVFLSVGVYNGLFSNGPIIPIPNFEIKKLFAAIASINYEFPLGAGNIALGLEGGYSSGSRFGGIGGVDFIPFGVNAAYVFPLTSFFYVGPRLKIGGLGLLADGWSDVVPTAGARLEAELRSTGFPLGLFVAGGIELFPFAPELAMLPVVEAGLRFPRGKITWSSSSKNKEPAGTNTAGSRDDLTGQSVATGTTTGTGTATTGSESSGAGGATTGAGTGTGTVGSGAAGLTAGTGTGASTGQTAGATQATGTPATVGSGTAGSGATGAAIAGGTQGRSIILEDGRQGILNSIYFEPDTAVLIESYRPILDSVGRQLAADAGLKLLIRAYAANYGTADGRYIVSSNRATFSRDYLTTQYRIAANRLSIEAFGADKSPIIATDDWQHRCVELILVRE